MKVLLKQDVDNLGYGGEVMNVADGYGRNYLIPQGLAVKATPGVLKQAETWRDKAAVRVEELRKEHAALAARIGQAELSFTARAGDSGKLYGSITTNDIVDQLNEVLGIDLDKRNVPGGPLRQLGDHKVTIRLSRDYQPQVKVVIDPFEEEEAELLDQAEAEDESDIEIEQGVDDVVFDEDVSESEGSESEEALEIEPVDEGESVSEEAT